MTIVSDDSILSFMGVSAGYFSVSSANNAVIFTSSKGGPVTLTLTSGTYTGAGLATELQTRMNASNTLKGLVDPLTFTVAYSTTTRLFTLTSSAGGTIAYTHSGSSAGMTLGFNADHVAALSITGDLSAGDPTAIVLELRDAVEKYVQRFCGRTFESTAHSLEEYDGRGYEIINLRNYPIISLDRVALGRLDIISVKNSGMYEHTASVSVTSTGLRLVYDGVANTTVTWVANTTLSAVVAAVNALGSGWTAQMSVTGYDSRRSSDLISCFGRSCSEGRWVYLQIPQEAEWDVEVYADWGQIRRIGGFPRGSRNVLVDYTAGYAAADMPEDLALAVKVLTKHFWLRRDEENWGASSYSAGELSVTFEKEPIPKEVKDVLDRYRRRPRLT